MKLVVKIAAGIILAFVVLVAGCSALVASSADEASIHSPELIDNPNASSGNDEYPDETVAQQQARKSAASYLDGPSAFSRIGLLRQLKYEGYSEADASYAVDMVSPDWNDQAAKSAAGYLDGPSAFSRKGLYDQLIYEGFTPAEANYGVNQTGL